jgi:ligand-binding sensor domain-containing protein/signal transduction histidine kinase
MNPRTFLIALWWLIFGVATASSRAAAIVTHDGSHYAVDSWTPEEGLPQSSVIAMIQTRDGYLWLGTLNGLVRFDGIRFTVFDEGNTPGLGSSRIFRLFEDSRRNLWVGTYAAGVALLSATDGRIHPLDLGREGRDQRLMSACEDAAGAVWLYTAAGQLCRYRDGVADVWNFVADEPSATRIVMTAPDGKLRVGTDYKLNTLDPVAASKSRELPILEEKLYSRKLDQLLAGRDGGYWVLADGRIEKWKDGRMEKDLGLYPWNATTTRISAVCEDWAGRLVVGTLGSGLFWFDAAGRATRLSKQDGLGHDYILSLLSDREGNLWVGTDGGGLNRLKKQVFDPLEATRGWVVQSVGGDDVGGLWIGANSGGVSYWRDGEMRRYLTNIPVRTVFVDHARRVWVGTRGAGLFEFQNGGLQQVTGPSAVRGTVSAIHQDHGGKLWIGTQDGLVSHDNGEWKVFTKSDGLSADAVSAIADDSKGGLWVGTDGGGLNLYREGRFTTFHKAPDALPGNDVSSLHVDAAGALWIGTYGSGLARFQNDRWSRYTTGEGLISNGVSYLAEDGLGYLWVGSNQGLMRIPKDALNHLADGLIRSIPCRAYGKPEGLPTRECTQGSQPAAFFANDGRLWLPTVEGLVSVKPAELRANSIPPPVVIESVSVDDAPQAPNALGRAPAAVVRIPPRRERLEIQYTALNLGAPDKARFRYRLEGHETAWTEAGDSRIARYSKLPPGSYRFHVTACNEDHVWNEAGAELAITVEPAFWQTRSFVVAVSLGVLAAIIGAVHYFSTQKLQRQLEKMKEQEALEKERARIARDLHDQLGASLTQVALLGELVESDKDSPAEVEALGQQVSRTARETTRSLDEIVWAANPSNDTLEGLANYITKHAQEYLAIAGVRCRLDVPAQFTADITLPPDVRHNVFLASKEAITNIVRHARASSARIHMGLERRRFFVEIQDDGQGLPDAGKTDRNGLNNMRRRMEEIGGEFRIGPSPGGGTTVRLTASIGKQ